MASDHPIGAIAVDKLVDSRLTGALEFLASRPLVSIALGGTMRRTVLFGILALSVCAADVHAQTALTGGRKVRFQDESGTSSDKGVVGFAKDPGLVLASPLCPTVTTLRVSLRPTRRRS
jgi:hypothetical protein